MEEKEYRIRLKAYKISCYPRDYRSPGEPYIDNMNNFLDSHPGVIGIESACEIDEGIMIIVKEKELINK